jgi:hypothetical protein
VRRPFAAECCVASESGYSKVMRFLLCFSLLSGLASFSRAAEPSEYCPLAEGMEWTMDAKVTSPDGKVIDTTAHRRIGAKEEWNGKSYYRMKTWIDGVPELRAYESLERRDEKGLYSVDLRNPKPTEVTSMVLPFAVGQKWTRENGEAPVTLEVVALENLTINGKTYEKCYRIKATAKGGSYTEELWQAPGLGSIKSDVVLSIGAKVSVALREFKAGK